MIEPTALTNPRRSILPQIFLGIVVIVILASVAMLIAEQVKLYFKYHDGRYAQEAKQVVSSLEHTLKQIEDSTPREATFALNKLISLDLDMAGYRKSGQQIRKYIVDRYVVVPQDIELNDPDYAKWDNNLVNQLYALVDKPTPIWFPSGEVGKFGRYDVVGRPRSLLDHEINVAVKNKEPERAYRALEIYQWFLNSVDWGSESENSTTYQHRDIYSLICGSLAADMWDQQQLNALREKFLGPIDYVKASRQQQLEIYASTLESSRFFQVLDYAPQDFATIYNHLERVDKNSDLALQNDVSYFESESLRRSAIMGIAAKLYKLKNNAWPTEISDLKEYGVPETFVAGRFSASLTQPKEANQGLVVRMKADLSSRPIEQSVIVK